MSIKRISAAENLIIELHPDSWRLLAFTEFGDERGVLEARRERPLRYATAFGTSRRLPKGGSLAKDYIWQVILGWSHDDDAWHLGLLLASDLASARGSRWCELVYWPDPDPQVFSELAQTAGLALAEKLNVPFNLIQPRDRRETAAPPPLPALPLEVGLWTLQREPSGLLAFKRSAAWVRGQLGRMVWYIVLTVIYLLLSISTLSSDLALPNAGTMLPSPELLPYLGLGIAVILVGMVLYIVYEIFTRPDRIVIDGANHAVVAMKGDTPRWRMNGVDMQAVYVTEVVNKRGSSNTIYQSDINLHLQDGKFKHVIGHEKKEEHPEQMRPADVTLDEVVMPLTRAEVRTDAQAIGVTIAEELGEMPCWYDQRTR